VSELARKGVSDGRVHIASAPSLPSTSLCVGRIRRVTFEEARAQFPVLERLAYLQAGSVGPLSLATSDAMRAEAERNLREGRAGADYIERIVALRVELRSELAKLVGVEPGQVALTGSTTDGCNIVLAGLDLDPGDEVVTTTDEHFGLLGPLHASGASVVVVAPDPDAILAAVTHRTKLLAVSHVLWTTGDTLPVHELRTETGLPILVDGAQSVGAIPVDALGLDFFTISGQKWLCGPESTGALVVAEPEGVRVARPSYFSQKRHDPRGAFEPWPDARRFDPCWVPAALMAGLMAAVALRPAWRYERAAATAARCRELLLAAGQDVVTTANPATLVSWRPAGEETAAVVERLYKAGVVVRDLPERGLVRASVGWWTSEEDLQRLVAALAAV
jgi:L-cysteine/cystine lyase